MEILTEEHLIMDQAVLVMMTMTYSSFCLAEKYHSIYIECEEDLSEYIFIFYGFIQRTVSKKLDIGSEARLFFKSNNVIKMIKQERIDRQTSKEYNMWDNHYL